MLLGFIVIVLIAAIAYFHYVQGFFSSTLSAMLAIVAAVLALSYHEPIVMLLLRGKLADQAHAMMLVVLFALFYSVLRLIFDKAVPGNIRLPVLLDRIGAAVMGAVAGMFAAGILIIAAQLLPFGPSIAGYARFDLADEREVRLPTGGQSVDSFVYDELKSDELDLADSSRLIIPVDDIVVNLTSYLSDGGSLAGPVNMAAVHPSYLDELFGQRLGIQTGALHVAYNLPSVQQVALRGVYTADALPQADGETGNLRREPLKLDPVRKPDPARIMLIVRLMFSRDASDKDSNVRFSTASVRLVAGGANHTPLGTLDHTQQGPLLRVNRPDDFLVVPSDGTVDFVFEVGRQKLGVDVAPKAGEELRIGRSVFVEAKRHGFVDLAGKTISRELPPITGGKVLRKKDLPAPKVAPGTVGTPARPAADVPIEFRRIDVSDRLFAELNVGPHDENQRGIEQDSLKADLREKRFLRLEVTATRTVALLGRGDHPIRELYVPPGRKMVQVLARALGREGDAWDWAERLAKFELVDGSGASYHPHGAWAKVKSGTRDCMVARYSAESPVKELSREEGRPTEVWMAFLVPQGAILRELRFDGKQVKTLDQKVE